MKHNPALHITGSVARTLLGLTFVFSGFVKAVDPLGTTYKIEDYLGAFGGFMTTLSPLAETAAWIMIAFEFVLGVLLILNIRTGITSWLALFFMLVMTPLTLWIALTNPVSDCGCFGDALVLTNWQTFWKNIVLLVLVILLLAVKRHIPQTFVWQAETGFALCALLLVAGLMLYTRLHLPLIDFRPYKIGNNITKLMEVPEGAPVDVYEVRLVYEKDGVKKEFTLSDYPKNDDSWTFVDQKSVLVKKGYEAPIHDFEIVNLEYDDITYDVLESEEPVTLVIMYNLEKTDRSQMYKALRLYKECQDKDEKCYFLTGSGENDIFDFAGEIGLEDYLESFVTEEELEDWEVIVKCLFCYTDPVTLKTVVRANPGVVVLQNGVVIDKYNLRNR